MSAKAYRPAGVTSRLMALIIDFFLTGCLGGLVSYLWVTKVQHHPTWDENTIKHIPALIFTLPYLIYEVVGVGIWGRTLGRKAAGIVVSKSPTDPSPPGLFPSGIRYLVKTALPLTLLATAVASGLSGMLRVIADLWPFVLLFTVARDAAHRQGLHDRAASTYALQEERLGDPIPGVTQLEN